MRGGLRIVLTCARVAVLTLAGCGGGEEVAYPEGEPFPSEPPWEGAPETGAILVNNDWSDQLAVLDLAEREPLAAVPVGLIPIEREGVHDLAVQPDGSRLYVPLSNYVAGSGWGPHGGHGTGSERGYAVELDVATLRPTASLLLDASPGGLALSPDGARLYVGHFDLLRVIEALDAGAPDEETFATVAVIDTDGFAEVDRVPACTTPHGLRVSADNSEVYVACYWGDEIAILDAETLAVERVRVGTAQVPLPNSLYGPYRVHVSPAGGRVWISCHASFDLRVLDPVTRAMDDACIVPVGGLPFQGMFLDGGATFAVPVQGAAQSEIVWVDTEACVVTARFALDPVECRNAHVVAGDRRGDDGPGYVVCEGDHVGPGSLLFLDSLRPPPGVRVQAVVTLGVYPDGIGFLYPGEGVGSP